MPVDFVYLLIGTAFGVVGWFSREMWSAVTELKEDLSALRESLPLNYIRKDDFKEFKNTIMSVLERIEAKIDHKVDKT